MSEQLLRPSCCGGNAALPSDCFPPFMSMLGIVAEVVDWPDAPLSPLCSCHAFDLGSAECIEAVHECNADLD
ncbi:hypothetical protein, partial [Gemmobacter serpentinus]|uniref:hypothetical protein n=1 Tax=Gemmobacter serpentinus TaxID=2652247 RepID=UPI001CF67E54